MNHQEDIIYNPSSFTTEPNASETMASNKRRKTVETGTSRPFDQSQLMDFGYDFNAISHLNQDFTLDATIPQDFLMFFSDNNNPSSTFGDTIPTTAIPNNLTQVISSDNSISPHMHTTPPKPTMPSIPTVMPTPSHQKPISSFQTTTTHTPPPSTSTSPSNPEEESERQQPKQQQQQQQQQQQKQTRQDDTLLEHDPPNQTVYTLIVGGKVFRLSWESLKSDGPSNFFLDHFRKKKTRVMHIDRDPDIFELIVRHLRGYYIQPKDDIQNQSLVYDASYYGLQRLKKLLQDYLYLNMAQGTSLQVP
ncbi:hypothetical protein BD560DRAFT_127989 [Blakeslea trispora]|nr:hypothetical protein BD560DRAFT_124453 [Blakeslea trispora]KAI8369047.1 hypothetical protein BD560DRAFT_127989 [Blakeslea trispora]